MLSNQVNSNFAIVANVISNFTNLLLIINNSKSWVN